MHVRSVRNAHFAQSVPPEQERRLVCITPTTQPGTPGNVPEFLFGPGVRGSSSLEQADASIQAVSELVRQRTGAIKIPDTQKTPEIESVHHSDELFELLARGSLPARRTLRRLFQERLVLNLPDPEDHGGITFATSALDLRHVSHDDRAIIMQEIIARNDVPELTLTLARGIQNRLETYQELSNTLQCKLDFLLQEQLGQEIMVDMKRVLQRGMGNETMNNLVNLKELLLALPQATLIELFKEPDKVERGLIKEKLKMGEGETPEQTLILNFLIDALEVMNDQRKIGGTIIQNPLREEEEKEQHDYLLSLENQGLALRSTLDERLKEIAGQLETLGDGARDRIWNELAEELPSPKEARNFEQLNSVAVRRFGLNWLQIDQAFLEAKTRLQIVRGELQSPGFQIPTPEKARGFILHAERTLDTLRQLETLTNLNPITKDATAFETNVHRFLQEKELQQEELESWACDINGPLEKIMNMPPERRQEITEKLQQATEGEITNLWEKFKEIHECVLPYRGLKGNQKELLKLRLDPGKCISFATHIHTDKARTGVFDGRNRDQLTSLILTITQIDDIHDDYTRKKEFEGKQPQQQGDIEAICTVTRQKLNDVMGRFLPGGTLVPSLSHKVCQALEVDKQLLNKQAEIEKLLAEAAVDATGRTLRQAKWEVEKLEESLKLLEVAAKEEDVVEEEIMHTGVMGYYDAVDRKRHIKKGLDAAHRKRLLEHEHGHAIIDILTRRTRILPNMLKRIYGLLQEHDATTGRTFEEQLRSLARRYHLEHQHRTIWDHCLTHAREQNRSEDWARSEADRLYLAELGEELLNRYATWVSDNRPDLTRTHNKDTKTERRLFLMLDAKVGGRLHPPSFDEKLLEAGTKLDTSLLQRTEPALRRHMVDDEQEEPAPRDQPLEESSTPRPRTSSENGESNQIKGELEEVHTNIMMMRGFRDSYPDLRATMERHINDAEEMFDVYNTAFQSNDERWDDPTFRKIFRDGLANLLEVTNAKVEIISKTRTQELDTTKKEKHKDSSLFANIRFLSVLDVMKFWNDTMEDIKEVFKRRQDRALKEVGKPITEALNKGRNIFYVGEYFDALKGYHERRYSGAEEEAANKWKDGMKNIDSHSILHLFHATDNKDQVRGMIALLTERGEMDWNTRSVLEKLAELSKYTGICPIDACLNDDVLRDSWYRKMISEIWNDKELYYHWRQENDSKIKSGMESFTPTVDQLSNVKGGMGAELEKQLRLWNEWKNPPNFGKGTPPEDVKAHLYEKVIFYAISNGKMTMEQKFYYLIRGVADGLLSIDRLRTMSGEEGGVLNQFPLIDYFYQKNNSLPEVQELAQRLTETKAGVDTFAPGSRTTLWLHSEVIRNERAQERLSKGTSGIRAEKIDHEDIPFFITNLDINAVDNLLSAVSGARQKVSPEGCKNAYVGFSSKFKIFSALLQAEEQGLERITQNDVVMLTRTLGGYIVMDNILTGNGVEPGKERPSITPYQLMQKAVSSANGVTTGDYRRGMNEFVGEILKNENLGGLIDKENLKVYNEKNEEEEFSLEKIAPTKADEFVRVRNKKTSALIHEATKKLVEAMTLAVQTPEGLRRFKKVLLEFGRREGQPKSKPQFYNEGGSENLKTPEVIEIIRERRRLGIKGEKAIHVPAAAPGGH